MGKKRSGSKSIYNPQYEEIIGKLKDTRKELGLKQSIVAERIGRYQSYLSKIENGDRRVDIMEFIELARLYEKDLNYFMPKDKPSKKK